MKADGSAKREVFDSACNDFHPAWSPDGTRIVFYSTGPNFPDSPEGLYTVRLDGTKLRYLNVDGMLPDWQARP